ncbi:uncharacterized protein CTHT_0041600 [Thermochaetoides thermophila DSM 1495]|uniref:VOC domain-containing protein n=1 Tax=Chaetomium thermophilum (strain DSM 1495 / CBS 144.50 / IMI 039719) TaxID=759272 RepID=G0SAA7_CHATD|nr:hypothetical protein CTHT_0041600 [Thermochaetoides thermophila DSM 1495]EGS19679.1 hypothetical protein CTHT_0041600 [Thermochaetoides thermophila DSM 1495]
MSTTTAPPTFIISVPTTDIPSAKSFYTSLNFHFLPDWSDASSISFILPSPNNNIALMLHTHDRVKKFFRPGAIIADPKTTNEALFSISVKKPEEVDEWLDKAVKAGGEKDPFVMKEYGKDMGMYSRSFADPDGHIWEVMCWVAKCGQTGEVRTE